MNLIVTTIAVIFGCINLHSLAEMTATKGSPPIELHQLVGQHQIAHSVLAYRSSNGCETITDRAATITAAIARSSLDLVDIDPSQKFAVSMCVGVSRAPCAVGSRSNSICATYYEWKTARTKATGSNLPFWTAEEVLVPSGCTCFLGGGKLPEFPLIIEHNESSPTKTTISD